MDSPLLQQLLAVVKVPSAQQPRQVKLLAMLLSELPAAPDTALLMALVGGLCELLLVPHPYSLHMQLKACITAMGAAAPRAPRMLQAALTVGLQADLFGRRSLLPDAVTPEGILRDGTMPGWLELLLDVPLALEVLIAHAPELLDLMARSVHAGLLELQTAFRRGRSVAATCTNVQAKQ